jgi:MFS family permease
LKIGTRKSVMALAQTEGIARLLRAADPALDVEIVKFETRGDQDQTSKLLRHGGKGGAFVAEIREAMRGGELQAAMHSLKDVPGNEETPGLIIAAIGGSLIKPSIVGTCARTTTEESKALGYSIYYSIVNIGGMLGPTLAVPIREHLGIAYVLVVASCVSVLLCAATFLFFREPPRPADLPPTKTMAEVLAGMLRAMSDVRFMAFLVIFSGFWLMFWHIFYALPFYVKDVLHYGRFELVESIGPWVIVLFTVPTAALARRMKPIAAMTLGFAIASSGWFVMGAIPTIQGACAGVAIFALGEALQAPRYYQYVADLAPREQVGTYMGIAFLPIAIGTFGTGLLAGRLVEAYKDAAQPSHMWYVLGGIGVVTTILMVVYDRFLAPRDRASAPVS